jgi:hypothetical protein
MDLPDVIFHDLSWIVDCLTWLTTFSRFMISLSHTWHSMSKHTNPNLVFMLRKWLHFFILDSACWVLQIVYHVIFIDLKRTFYGDTHHVELVSQSIQFFHHICLNAINSAPNTDVVFSIVACFLDNSWMSTLSTYLPHGHCLQTCKYINILTPWPRCKLRYGFSNVT